MTELILQKNKSLAYLTTSFKYRSSALGID